MDCNVFGIIYKITNIVNNKCYIGQTTRSLDVRFYWHCFAAFKQNSQFRFHRALRKYPKENWVIETIDTANTKEELINKEIHWIAYYDAYRGGGYNSTRGGEWGDTLSNHPERERICRQISRTKLSRGSSKGEKNGMYGRTHTPEARKIISEARKGSVGPWRDKRMPEYAKLKMSLYRAGKSYEELYGAEKAKEVKSNHSTFMKQNNPMKGRSVYSIWLEKYGREEADRRKEEMRIKRSNSLSGVNNPFYGKKHSEEARQKIRESKLKGGLS